MIRRWCFFIRMGMGISCHVGRKRINRIRNSTERQLHNSVFDLKTIINKRTTIVGACSSLNFFEAYDTCHFHTPVLVLHSIQQEKQWELSEGDLVERTAISACESRHKLPMESNESIRQLWICCTQKRANMRNINRCFSILASSEFQPNRLETKTGS